MKFDTPVNHSEFAARLRAVMRDRGLTQAKLAALTNVTQPTVSFWLNEGAPKPEMAERLATKLHVNFDWMLFGEGVMESSIVQETVGQPPPPYSALAPLIWKLYEEFSSIIADLPAHHQEEALRKFRTILIDPLSRPEKMLSFQLGISEAKARKIIQQIEQEGS